MGTGQRQAETLAYERGRLAALERYRVLDTPVESVFVELAEAAAAVTGMPVAAINLVDADRVWAKAYVGAGVRSCPRDDAFCAVVVRSRDEVVITDATADARVEHNPWVTSEPFVRAYVGMPLRDPDGFVLGTLCTVGFEPTVLAPPQLVALRALAGQAMAQLELRLALARQREALDAETAAHAEAEALTVRLGHSEERYRNLVAFASDVVIAAHGPDGTLRYVSPSVTSVLGLDPLDRAGRYQPLTPHPDDAGKLAALHDAATRGVTGSATVRLAHADGTWHHIETTVTPRAGADGAVDEVFSASRDVTARVRAAEALAAERAAAELDRRRLAALLEAIDIAVVACDAEGHVTHTNPAADALAGPDGIMRLLTPGTAQLVDADQAPLARALAGDEVTGQVVGVADEAGVAWRTLRCSARRLVDPSGALLGAVVAMADLTREAAHASQLAGEALTDPLTGLLNRRGWDLLAAATVEHAATTGAPVAVAMIDLDHFKRVNDRLGHAEGDAVLTACAAAWQVHLRPGDVLARLGGEEFALALPACSLEAAADIVERLRATVPAGLTASAGVTLRRPGDTLAATLARADIALYAAKGDGRDRTTLRR